MDFDIAVNIINTLLEKEKPKTFSSSWILSRTPAVYHFVRKNLRTENNDIDWDSFTIALDRQYLRRWIRYKRKSAKTYENQFEVEIILTKYKDKLYTFITSAESEDKEIRNKIVIAPVRTAQKGNILAQEELIKWLRYVIDDWIDKYHPLFKWKGYDDEINEKIKGCIRGYKYTGSFMGYLFKTLQYSARGMRSLQAWSLDDLVGEDGATKVDFLTQDTETGEVKLFGK